MFTLTDRPITVAVRVAAFFVESYANTASCIVVMELTWVSPYAPPFYYWPTEDWIEGPWSEVMKAIHDCHAAVHAKGAPRIATDIRIGTRVDREITPGTGNEGKVKRVQDILAKDAA